MRDAGLMLLAACLATILGRPLAAADTSAEQTQGKQPAGGKAKSASLFKQLDADGDGQLTTDEVGGDKARLFKRLLRTSDADRNGSLSVVEFAAGLTSAAPISTGDAVAGEANAAAISKPRNPAPIFKRLDANGDGNLEVDELPAARRAFFNNLLKRLDADGNGVLSREEFAKFDPAEMAAKQKPPGEQPDEKKPEAGKSGESPSEEEKFPGINLLVRRALEADANGDKKLSLEETPKKLQKAFGKIDANGDGQLSAKELRARFVAAAKKQQANQDTAKKSDTPSPAADGQ